MQRRSKRHKGPDNFIRGGAKEGMFFLSKRDWGEGIL